ncbi:MAG: hypothetical protein ACFFAE_04730 [Candidatus Hodarchaeota archaeon]
MTAEFSVELNAKKIQTLTKVAKLLREQIQEQNKNIESLQLEILKIKEQLERITGPSTSPFLQTKENISSVTTPSIQHQPFQKEAQLPEIEKLHEKSPIISLSEKSQDDKEQLLKALKVIDEL